MSRAVSLACIVLCGLALPAACQTAVIDTTAGRLTCFLLPRERPATTAAFLAEAESGTRPYDGARIFPSSGGISAAGRGGDPGAATLPAAALPIETVPVETVPVETVPPLLFDRPGLLAIAARKGQANPLRLLIADHGNAELDGSAVVFGRCDEPSVKLVAQLRHTLASTDNHPPQAIVINHIAILRAGQAVPPPAPAVAASAIQPPFTPSPLPPPAGPEPTGPIATFETSAGNIACRLFTRESPIATQTFLGLADGSKAWTDPRDPASGDPAKSDHAKSGHAPQHGHRFYDGMALDRVLPDYYIQFGDITGDISGDTDIGFHFKNENTPGLTFDRPGRLAFGNGGPDTNASELFFSLNPMHALDGGFPIIGQCDEPSLKILDAVAHQPRDRHNLPLTPVVIRRVVVQPSPSDVR